jgi:uncharacterized protein (DUF1501 family)
MNRRDFFTGTLSAAAAQLARQFTPAWVEAPVQSPLPNTRLVFAPPGIPIQNDVLVIIFQRGGMDGLNAVIPYGEGNNYYDLRPSLKVQEPSSGNNQAIIDLDGFFGLNPSLASLKNLWDDQALAIVHACGSPDPTHSHFDAMDYMERGTPGEKQIPTGWLARHLETVATRNQSPFRAVGMGPILPTSLHGPVSATSLNSIASFHLGGANRTAQITRFQNELALLYSGGGMLDQEAVLTFQAMDALAKLNPKGYTPSNGAKYPGGYFGSGLMQIAELIKANVGLEIATIDIGGWDTHVEEGAIQGQMPKLMTDLADGLLAFYSDLGDAFKNVTVVTMSEFGRRVQENGGGGTDHGHGNVMFVASKNINATKVYGKWPGLAPAQLVAPGDLQVTTDYRTVLAELLQKRAASPQVAQVFPGFDTTQNLGIFKTI